MLVREGYVRNQMTFIISPPQAENFSNDPLIMHDFENFNGRSPHGTELATTGVQALHRKAAVQ